LKAISFLENKLESLKLWCIELSGKEKTHLSVSIYQNEDKKLRKSRQASYSTL
jgi:hypothetical protein